jgi:hypothetical protein
LEDFLFDRLLTNLLDDFVEDVADVGAVVEHVGRPEVDFYIRISFGQYLQKTITLVR